MACSLEGVVGWIRLPGEPPRPSCGQRLRADRPQGSPASGPGLGNCRSAGVKPQLLCTPSRGKEGEVLSGLPGGPCQGPTFHHNVPRPSELNPHHIQATLISATVTP